MTNSEKDQHLRKLFLKFFSFNVNETQNIQFIMFN